MSIKISEHILSLDENILGVSLFSNSFHMIETVARPLFERRFQVGKEVEKSSSAYAAVVYGMAKLLEDSFGDVEKISVDYGKAKLILLTLKNGRGFVGLVLNRSASAEYLVVKIQNILEETDKELDALV